MGIRSRGRRDGNPGQVIEFVNPRWYSDFTQADIPYRVWRESTGNPDRLMEGKSYGCHNTFLTAVQGGINSAAVGDPGMRDL